MIGVLIVTHGNLGCELIKAAEMIKGDIKGITSVSLDAKKGVKDIKKEITSAIKRPIREGCAYYDRSVWRHAFKYLPVVPEKGKVEVVTGVNLPMLLKISDIRGKRSLLNLPIS